MIQSVLAINNRSLLFKILDVTLRDGRYRNNFHFSSTVIDKIVEKLHDSGIDYIEIGYRNGSFKPIANIGITGISSDHYLNELHINIQMSN